MKLWFALALLVKCLSLHLPTRYCWFSCLLVGYQFRCANSIRKLLLIRHNVAQFEKEFVVFERQKSIKKFSKHENPRTTWRNSLRLVISRWCDYCCSCNLHKSPLMCIRKYHTLHAIKLFSIHRAQLKFSIPKKNLKLRWLRDGSQLLTLTFMKFRIG